MSWKKLPYWLRGGIVGGIVGLISSIFNVTTIIASTSKSDLAMGGISVLYLFLGLPILGFIFGGIAGIIHKKSRLSTFVFFMVIGLVYYGFAIFMSRSDPTNYATDFEMIMLFILSMWGFVFFSLGLLWIFDNIVNSSN